MSDVSDNVVSIKERIERQARRELLSRVEGIGRVFRWDGRGIVDPETGKAVDENGQRLAMKPGDAMLVPQDESTDEGGQGGSGAGGGYTIKTLPLQVQLILTLPEDAQELEAAVENRWLYRLERALLKNPGMLESTDDGVYGVVSLAIDIRTKATLRSPREVGQRETVVGIEIEITYQHERADPAAAPGVVALAE